MFRSQYPNLNALFNSVYGKVEPEEKGMPNLRDVAIRTAALRLSVDSFDVEIPRDTQEIGSRASVFEAYLRNGLAGVRSMLTEHKERLEADDAKDARICDLEAGLYAIGTAFAKWESAVRTPDNYFHQETDLSAANAAFYDVVKRALESTPMPHEVAGMRRAEVHHHLVATSPQDLMEKLGKLFEGFGSPSDSIPTVEKVGAFLEGMDKKDCDCPIHRPGEAPQSTGTENE